MPDPVEPIDPQPGSSSAATPPPVVEPEVNASTLDLPANVAAALACIPLIGGIIFYIMEKRDGFVRFFAMQSIIFGLAWLLYNIASGVVRFVFAEIPGIGPILLFFWAIINALIQIAFLVVWIVATIKAFSGVRWDIPYIGPMARKQVDARSAV